MIDEATQRALFVEMHAAVEETAATLSTAAGIEALRAKAEALGVQLHYPPGAALTTAEWQALREALRPGVASVAFRKLLAHACAQPLFHLLCVLDGVAAPTAYSGVWTGLTLSPTTEEDEQPGVAFLHDDFGETYWVYKQQA